MKCFAMKLSRAQQARFLPQRVSRGKHGACLRLAQSKRKLIDGDWALSGFTENRYGYTYHYEACSYRIVVTRADGRKFTLPGEYHFCGYGTVETHDKVYGDKSYYQFRHPSDYGIEDYITDSAE